MAEFPEAFEKTIRNEGGFILHEIPGDRGGKTYAGIAHNAHPNWGGWAVLERNPDDPKITQMVRDFYKEFYWDRVKGDAITHQDIAESIFDFGVNTGVRTASKLAQLVANVTPDGIIGDITVGELNRMDSSLFVSNYALAKIARYAGIVKRDQSQGRFLLGWINRTLEGLA